MANRAQSDNPAPTSGLVVLVACIVQTLQKSDPTFQKRFLDRLEAAYRHLKDEGREEDLPDLEVLQWTRELLTGFSFSKGKGEPFLSDFDADKD